MASIEVTITGMLYDKQRRTTQNVVLIGEASYSGLGVGGGPMPGGGAPVDPGYGVPGGIEGTRPPPGGVDPGWGNVPGARPSHPIYNPPPAPPTDGADKPPPEDESGWGFYDGRWGYFPGPGDATPKR